MTLPRKPVIVDERTETDPWLGDDAAIGDGLRHIVCYLCYPAFAEQKVAPHDAECVCGKPLRAGDSPGPDTAPDCVLCDEMADPHYRRLHAER
ncbi:MAG TPA: hypothetical protein VFN97_26140 [Actinospica sp.]|nr:hypothetical protein [Actinospica sp.]